MILVEDLHSYFDLWIDKVGSPYFTSNQKDDFLNRAIVNFVNQYLKNPSSHILEDTHVDTEDVYTLINSVELTSSPTGILLFSDINSALPTGKEWMYILSIGRGSDDECGNTKYKSRWVRHNDVLAHRVNSFKKPEPKYPIHRYYSNYLRFEPEGQGTVEVTTLVYPNKVTLDDDNDEFVRGPNAIDLDLPNKVFNEIVYLALSQAGISIRESDFYATVQNEINKNV